MPYRLKSRRRKEPREALLKRLKALRRKYRLGEFRKVTRPTPPPRTASELRWKLYRAALKRYLLRRRTGVRTSANGSRLFRSVRRKISREKVGTSQRGSRAASWTGPGREGDLKGFTVRQIQALNPNISTAMLVKRGALP